MIVSTEPVIIIKAYLPLNSRIAEAQFGIIRMCGGATVYRAYGFWLDAEGVQHAEHVESVEAIYPGTQADAIAELTSIGTDYLNSNPGEKAFLVYVGGDRVYINREEIPA